MKILMQVAIIFGIFWVSQGIELILPISFPASVISLILLLILLGMRIVKLEQIKEKTDFVLGNLAFFFVPVAVSIMGYVDFIRGSGAAFLVICVVSTVLTFAATAWAVQLTNRWLQHRKGGGQ